MIKAAINGFGRIGRNTFKAGWGKKGMQFVAINDLTDTETLAYLLKHDTVYGEWDHKVSHTKNALIIDGEKIPAYREREPEKLPWKEHKVDVALECTGVFTKGEDAGKHLDAGAKRVIISAPSKGGTVGTYLKGVNSEKYKSSEKVIDNASCTTNCIAPIAAIVQSKWGVKKAGMTTIHAYTSTQNLVDGPHKDPRRGRAAGQNIVPTTTGAAVATTRAIPSLEGKFDGLAIRVPVVCGSISDFTFFLKKKATEDEVRNHFKKISKNPIYKGVVAVSEKPLVSTDFIGNPHSAIIDLPMIKVIDGDLLKVLVWYDNEWGYSNRLVEMAIEVGKKIKK